MADTPKNYDSTIMRMAGNIAAGMVAHPNGYDPRMEENWPRIAEQSVGMARAIVAEVLRTSADGVAPRKDGQ